MRVVCCAELCVFVLVFFEISKTKKREREETRRRPDTTERRRQAFCGPVREKPHKKKRVEMASFAEAPAGDVAKGTLSPSFFLSLFSLVCECDNIY